MKIELSILAAILGILTPVGIFAWFILGRILTDKKDKLTLQFQVENLKQEIKDLKIDTDKIDRIQRDIDLIQERIKHL